MDANELIVYLNKVVVDAYLAEHLLDVSVGVRKIFVSHLIC